MKYGTRTPALRWMSLVLCFCLHPAADSLAQSDNTQISGYVRDISGAAVPQVKIVVSREGSLFERSASSNEAGYYILAGLPPGLYSVSAERSGFKRHRTEHRKLDPSIAATQDILLQIGEVSETVLVEASASAFQAESATVGKLIERRQLDQLQLNGRNPVFLALLKPGVSGPNPMNVFSYDTRTNGSLFINGARAKDTLVTYDGAVGIRTRAGSFLVGVADVDAVQEVQVLTANYSAEYGRSAGGQIRVVTRSGTRDFHGNFYDYFRNSALDANSWSRNSATTSASRPCAQYPQDAPCRPAPFHYNQFGYNLSGPVTLPFLNFNRERSKLFWLWSQEWVRHRQTTTVSMTVPSLPMTQGDFSELLDPANRFFGRARAITDPLTGKAFPGNIIPANRLSPSGAGLLKAYPDPTAGYIGPGSANYYQEGPNWANQRKDTLSVDYNPAAQHSSRWRAQPNHFSNYSWKRNSVDMVPWGLRINNQTTSLGWTWAFSAQAVNELLVTGSRDQVHDYLEHLEG